MPRLRAEERLANEELIKRVDALEAEAFQTMDNAKTSREEYIAHGQVEAYQKVLKLLKLGIPTK